jgi:hypothetical protein
MTSSGTSTDRRGGVSVAVVVLGVAGIALLAGWIFVLWHHRFHVTAPAIVLMLGWMAVLSVVYFLWRTADNADLDDHQDWWKPTGRMEELVREKKSLLKAIKETELDRDTAKLSAEDAADMIARYRARAIDVIKAIDDLADGRAAEHATDVRDRIEREVRARVAVDRRRPGRANKPRADGAKARAEAEAEEGSP